jgi:hypothetical protein
MGNAIALAQLGASVELRVAQLSRASFHSQTSQSTFRTSNQAIRQTCTSSDAYDCKRQRKHRVDEREMLLITGAERPRPLG